MSEHSAVAVASARLRLLGGWQLVVDGAEVALGHREQRLVALLGLAAPGTRAQVASMLWPDSTDEHALGSLRRAVWHCQRKCPGLLSPGRSTLTLAPEIRVDTDDLRRAAGLTELPMDDGAARELLDALRGPELLPGWFDDWVVEERPRLQQLRVEALERVAQHGLDHDEPTLVVEAATAAGEIEPLRESAREMSIRGHLGLGDVASARHELRRYHDLLDEELGVAPSERIQALVDAAVTAPAPAPVPPPVAVPRQRVAPADDVRPRARLEPPPLPPVQGLAEFLGDDRRTSGLRRAGAALVGAAGVALAVSLGVALTGPDRSPEANRDPGAARVVTQAAPTSTTTTDPARTVRVRTVRTVAGSAAFAVQANQRPAQVRLVVRGKAGLRVVRHVVVRGAGGRQVLVTGLDAGTYEWSATSASAPGVRGEVSVTPPPVTATPDVVTAAQTPSQAPSQAPTQTPSTSPSQTATPSHTPTPTPTPTPSPSHTPSPSPSARPTGTPTDPGTVAPTPVG
ncbi:BTAD domain-containing putative transcriptional regulator [Nocardioides sp.]|uniref:BTAD domain-containing putative transcriptional regulator n=1 Tax=Nocardioides sp. TaxID=35761 RepID=UPI0035B4A468